MKKPIELLANGFGGAAAIQTPEQTLRRLVMASLLWEKLAYESGEFNALAIKEAISKVPAPLVASIAVEARTKQHLRHTPLFIAAQMCKLPSHRPFVGGVLEKICTRPDMLGDFLALYQMDNKEAPIAKQVKIGLARAFVKFSEYQIRKYASKTGAVSLRDVMFLVHPNPVERWQVETFKKLANKELEPAETWEVMLSAGANKCRTFTELIESNKLGGLALLRNLRGMLEAKVDERVIRGGLERMKAGYLLPMNFLAAAQNAPSLTDAIEQAMYRCYRAQAKLPGTTVFAVDRSGSMNNHVSDKSQHTRLDVAMAMAVLARERCENAIIYATAGFDGRGHKTVRVSASGFKLIDEIRSADIGGGGIFTRQCLEFIRGDLGATPVDRIIVFSDSQDMDRTGKKPAPFGQTNYIVDVSAHSKGINYDQLWTAEVSGWSDHFLDYIFALEGVDTVIDDEAEAETE